MLRFAKKAALGVSAVVGLAATGVAAKAYTGCDNILFAALRVTSRTELSFVLLRRRGHATLRSLLDGCFSNLFALPCEAAKLGLSRRHRQRNNRLVKYSFFLQCFDSRESTQPRRRRIQRLARALCAHNRELDN